MNMQLKILSFLALFSIGFYCYAQEREKPMVAAVDSAELEGVKDVFQEHFFEALKQKAIENHEKAITALVQSLAVDALPVVYLELGKNYNALRQYGQAAAYLEKGRSAVPKNTAILEELYKTYFLSERFEKALPVVKQLSLLDASFSEDLVNLYILNERYNEALTVLDSLDGVKGSSTSRDGLRRQVYSRTNNVEAQLQDLEQKIAEDPDDEKNYLNLIFVYSENGRPQEAFETAEELLERNPSSELVHLALYKFYLNENNTGKAVNSMRILLGSHQIDEVTKYQALNDFLMYVSENPSLEEDLIELVQVFSEDEQNTKVYGQLGTFFLEKRKNEQALKYFQLALETENADFVLYKNVLKLQLEFGKFGDAAILSEKAIEIFPSQPLLYYIKGKAQNKEGQFAEAEESLLFGLDFLIDDPVLEKEFFLELAEAYSGLGKTEKAMEYRKKANKLEKNN